MSTDNNDPDSVRERHEADERWEVSQRRHRIFTMSCVLLTAAVVSLAWYAYPILKRHDAFITQFSGPQFPGLQRVTAALDDRVHQVDVKISEWRNNQQELRNQFAKLRRETQEHLETAQQQAREATDELLRNAQSRVDGEIEDMKATLALVESSHDDEQTRVAALQQELAEVRQEIAQQAADLSAVRSRMDANAASSQQQIASLQESQQRDRHDVDAIAGSLAVQRIDFELTTHRSRELAPGISMDITGTDVRYDRVNGWIWVMPDHRTIWLRGQAAQEPVVFYGDSDAKKREVVITRVTQSSVVGYLLLPRGTDSSAGSPFPQRLSQ